jgi:hypothetical protein
VFLWNAEPGKSRANRAAQITGNPRQQFYGVRIVTTLLRQLAEGVQI